MKKMILRIFSVRGWRIRPVRKWWLVVFLLAQAFVFPAFVYSDIPPAGVTITSQSRATYYKSGSLNNVFSNDVSLGVLPVYASRVTPDGTTGSPAVEKEAFPGETVTFSYVLLNSGNVEGIFELYVNHPPGSDFNMSRTAVYLDQDGDSLIDAGESEVASVGPLAMGEEVSLILEAELPAGGIFGGDVSYLNLTSRSVEDTSSFDQNNVVRVRVRDDASVPLTIQSDKTEVMPGEMVEYTVHFNNPGERPASQVRVSDFIDYTGLNTGTELVYGTVTSTLPGTIEYFDIQTLRWVDVAPSMNRLKGIRLSMETLLPGQSGTMSFMVRVDDDREWGNIVNSASSEYRGADSGIYTLSSNEISVMVGKVSSLAIGPMGNPNAPTGTAGDRVVHRLNGRDTTLVFWHELLNAGNFTDTLEVVLRDSLKVPSGCQTEFVDSSGVPLTGGYDFGVGIGPVERGVSRIVGLRLSGSLEALRGFPGNETVFNVEVLSRVDDRSRDSVEDVLIKSDIPVISVTQSVKEPTAVVGDILSYIVTVENLTSETNIDSVVVREHLSHGLDYAGGNRQPLKKGNTLRWSVGSLEPGRKLQIIFRARVRAGQEWGDMVSSATVFGVTTFGERVMDGPAVSSVRIVEGVFTRRGIILGSVFRDADGDGSRSDRETGVYGVSVFIEDGTYAVTDSSGMYSIPGVNEGTHVVRVDPSTFPDSLTAGDSGYFSFGEKGELMVELPPSGDCRADFPLVDLVPIDNPGSREDNTVYLDSLQSGVMGTSGGVEQWNSAADHSGGVTGSGRAEVVVGVREDAGLVHDNTEGCSKAGQLNGTRAGGLLSGGISRDPPESASTPGQSSGSFSQSPPESASTPGQSSGSFSQSPPESTSTPGQSSGSIISRLQNGETFSAISISDLCFAPGEAVMEEVPLRQVASLALWMRNHPAWKIEIEGHTDNVPISSKEFPSNLELSLARARSVFQLLRMNDIPADRMDYTGFGSRKPVATNNTPEGRSRNRRVEINLKPPENYSAEQHGLPPLMGMADTTTFTLAGEEGVCAEVVKPQEGAVFRSKDQIDVTVSSPLGSSVELYVNDIPVGRERIGQKQVDIRKRTIEVIFYGVRIKPGNNRILVVCRQFGGKSHKCMRNVYLAGRIDGIVTEREMVSVPSDGRTSPRLIFLIRDERGLPVRDGIFMEVEGPSDLIGHLDRNPDVPGVQMPTTNGKVILELPPSNRSRRDKIYLSHAKLSSCYRVAYVSSPRDWFLIGFGEGKLGYSDLSGGGNTYGSRERYHDGLFAEGLISFYGKGKVSGNHLLTCAVNTRPIREDRLFRKIEPEKYYPIYGDASRLEFNTSSRSGTYIKVDHRNYSAMLGDFRTDLGSTEFTRYHRSFNGVKGEGYMGKGKLGAFITRTDQATYQEEMRADGTSGFYFLEHYPIVENSEKVRIEVRDRYRPEEIIKIDYKKINRDYDINYMDGSLLFKKPIPSTDDNLNPVTIVVSYECKTAEQNNYIYGMRTSVDVTGSIRVGTTAVLEEEGTESSSLVGVDLGGRLNSSLSMEGEYAHSEKYLHGSGNAFRMKLRGDHGKELDWSAYYRDIDQTFYNPSFSGGKTELGSKKIGGGVEWEVRDDLTLEAKGFRHSLRERNEKKKYAHLLSSYSAGAITGRTGLGYASHSDTRDGDQSEVLLLLGAGYRGEKSEALIEYDQILDGEEVQEYPNRLQAKVSRKVWRSLSAVLNHEYRTGSRTGTRHLTQIGLESGKGKNLHLFSRYRLEGAMSGQRGQAIIGLENRFSLTDHLTSTLSAERHATVSGRSADDFTAFRTGWLYTPGRAAYKLKGEYEIRIEKERMKHLLGVGGVRKMSERWSAMTKGDLWFTDQEREEDRVKGRSTVGLSLRPTNGGPLTLLSLLRLRYERNSPAHPGAVDWDLTSSLEANYKTGGKYEIEGKFVTRWVRNTFKTYTASASSFMYQGRIIRVIGEVWDIGLTGRLVHQKETHTVRYGSGIEFGRKLAGKLWAGAGYSFGGHMDRDTPCNEFDANGFYLRLRMKFNEKLLGYFYENLREGWKD